MRTIDKVLDGKQMKTLMAGRDHTGDPLGFRVRIGDNRYADTSGAFLVGELERIDMTQHDPLFSVSYDRDVPLRDDVTLGDEVSSFTQSTFGTPSGPGTGSTVGQKRSFIGKKSTQLPEMEVDIAKSEVPLLPWGEGIAYSLPELTSAAQIGRPIDQQKMTALDKEYQLQTDAQVYLGWTGNSTFGLINNTNQVTPTNFANGAAGGPQWMPHTGYAGKTSAEILTDLATLAYTPWAASGFAVKPNRIGLDPQNFNYIRIQPATTAGSKSILQYFLESYNMEQDTPLRIVSIKWLTGAGAGGTLLQQGTTNRAVAWHRYDGEWQNAPVRFPMTLLARTPIQYDGLWHKFYKWGRMGACEFVYPETVCYMDGN